MSLVLGREALTNLISDDLATRNANKGLIENEVDLKAPLANPTFTGTVAGVTKAMVGLGSADNTADANKPVSGPQQTALNLKETVVNVNTLKGAGWTTESVKGNAIAIATNLENIALKGGYFSPTDVMGLNGRDLVTVLGATGASADLICKDAFAKLRAISSTGDFTGLRLGDYIDIPALSSGAINILNSTLEHTLRAVIFGYDHYYNTGDIAVPAHHVLMQFENAPITHAYNATNTNTGGYAASGLYTWLHGDLQTAIISAIGLTPLTVHRLLSNHGTWAWMAESVFIPTEVEVFGHQAWGRGGYYTGSSLQFPLFASNPKTKVKLSGGGRVSWWVATDRSGSSTNFCYAGNDGSADASYYGASGVLGVVPAFLV